MWQRLAGVGQAWQQLAWSVAAGWSWVGMGRCDSGWLEWVGVAATGWSVAGGVVAATGWSVAAGWSWVGMAVAGWSWVGVAVEQGVPPS